MNRAIFCLFIVLKAGMTECGLKSHAELIRQADKVDKKIKAYKLTGFAKGNSEFDENYKNLRIPLSENYTNLHNKLEHIRVFEAYNKERLQLEKGIMSIISKMNTSTTENCEKFYKKLRQHLVLKLTDANLNKMEALKNIQNRWLTNRLPAAATNIGRQQKWYACSV
ncbi:uncharacterized protein [Drosophila takahashii]|uniref:uncharacterized protein isoform X4 n=1 Tax=Drosophila takahashii TaxID=29030 RepID=UPI00389926E0